MAGDRWESCWWAFLKYLSDTYVRSQVTSAFFGPFFFFSFSGFWSLAMSGEDHDFRPAHSRRGAVVSPANSMQWTIGSVATAAICRRQRRWCSSRLFDDVHVWCRIRAYRVCVQCVCPVTPCAGGGGWEVGFESQPISVGKKTKPNMFSIINNTIIDLLFSNFDVLYTSSYFHSLTRRCFLIYYIL